MDGSWPLKTPAKKVNDDNSDFTAFDEALSSFESEGFEYSEFEAMSLDEAAAVAETAGVYA